MERVLSESGEQLRYTYSLLEENKRLETILKRVKSEVAGRLVRELGMLLGEVARLLGVYTSAISKILRRKAHKGRE